VLPARTALVVAHRLTTIDRADTIAVLDQGQLVECGRHVELRRRGGPYVQLFGAAGALEVAV
jgi:ABC-type transport system involved in Fe-S cluster assembly fused permease/ATPase subunit